MARAVVCVGVPQDLEESTFTYKNGDRAGEVATKLSFKLGSASTQLVGSVLFETNSDKTRQEIQAAFDEGREIQVVASPQVIRSEKTNDYGKPMDWVKMTARAVV